MRLLNLPKVLRTYEVLWAVGTMFGATQKVDMVTTRESKFGRFKVAVLNPTIVPTKMDCVIGTHFFELQFEIESFVASGEIVQSGPKENTGGDGSGNHDGDTEMENANKKAKQLDFPTSKQSEKPKSSENRQHHDADSFMEDFDDDDLLYDVGKIVPSDIELQQGPAGSTVSPSVESTMLVNKGEVLAHAPCSATGIEGEKKVAASTDSPSMFPSLALDPLSERAIIGLKETNGDLVVGGEEGLVVGNQGDVTPLEAVLVEPVQSSPLRRSERREATVDEDSTARAIRLATKRNLEVAEGKTFNNSILSFLNEHVADKVKNIGISIGKDASIVQSSVMLMKKVEKDRFKLPSSIQTYQDSHLDLDESNCELDHLALGHLCGDLTEELMDDNNTLLDLSSRPSK
jgi:hypothetical protein